jgi:AcrR family transcriptional regulator
MAMSEDEFDAEAPGNLARAWGIGRRPTKGPKPGLSIERIVAAGVHVAETEGLASVSMGSVAAEIGSSAMSLYRYVASKDELLALMVDFAIGAPLAAPDVHERWRPGLERWAEGLRARLHRCPWALTIASAGPPVMPYAIAWLENGLQRLRATDLSEQERLSTMLLLGGFVRAETMLSAGEASMRDSGPGYGRVLGRLTDSTDFPALHRAIADGAMDDLDEDQDGEFIFGLDRILDGIDVLIRIRAGMSDSERA